MFKVYPKNMFWYSYCKLWTYFTPFSSASIVDFEQVNVGWVFREFKWINQLLFPLKSSEDLWFPAVFGGIELVRLNLLKIGKKKSGDNPYGGIFHTKLQVKREPNFRYILEIAKVTVSTPRDRFSTYLFQFLIHIFSKVNFCIISKCLEKCYKGLFAVP